jgi:hypothetical protein
MNLRKTASPVDCGWFMVQNLVLGRRLIPLSQDIPRRGAIFSIHELSENIELKSPGTEITTRG